MGCGYGSMGRSSAYVCTLKECKDETIKSTPSLLLKPEPTYQRTGGEGTLTHAVSSTLLLTL